MLKTFQLYCLKAVQPKCVPAAQSWNWPATTGAVVLNSSSRRNRICLLFFLAAKRLLGARRCSKGGWRTEEKGKDRSFEGLEKMWYNERLKSFSLFIVPESKFVGDVISGSIFTRGKC